MSRHLMAKMRHGSMFDWKQRYREDDLGLYAKAETGHLLELVSPEAQRGAGREIAARGPDGKSDMGWMWTIHDLNDPNPNVYGYDTDVWHLNSSQEAQLKGGLIHAPDHGTDQTVYSGDHLPTKEDAARQAGQAYMELARSGTRHLNRHQVDYGSTPEGREPLDYGDFGGMLGGGK